VSSFIVAQTCHARPVSFLVVNRDGSHRWTINRDGAYRFSSASAAIFFAGSIIDGGGVAVLSDDRPATVDRFGSCWRVSPPDQAGNIDRHYVPLEPWCMSTGQRVAVLFGVGVVLLLSVALVAGW
jgi:hypothetical protein